METITFKTLGVLLDEYKVEFIEDYRIKSNVLGYTGSIFLPGGFAVKNMEEAQKYSMEVYRPRNLDIGYFDLENMEGWKKAYERRGYDVEVIF